MPTSKTNQIMSIQIVKGVTHHFHIVIVNAPTVVKEISANVPCLMQPLVVNSSYQKKKEK